MTYFSPQTPVRVVPGVIPAIYNVPFTYAKEGDVIAEVFGPDRVTVDARLTATVTHLRSQNSSNYDRSEVSVALADGVSAFDYATAGLVLVIRRATVASNPIGLPTVVPSVESLYDSFAMAIGDAKRAIADAIKLPFGITGGRLPYGDGAVRIVGGEVTVGDITTMTFPDYNVAITYPVNAVVAYGGNLYRKTDTAVAGTAPDTTASWQTILGGQWDTIVDSTAANNLTPAQVAGKRVRVRKSGNGEINAVDLAYVISATEGTSLNTDSTVFHFDEGCTLMGQKENEVIFGATRGWHGLIIRGLNIFFGQQQFQDSEGVVSDAAAAIVFRPSCTKCLVDLVEFQTPDQGNASIGDKINTIDGIFVPFGGGVSLTNIFRRKI